MDAAAWTAIVGPITTLLGGLGGYWLAGRNDDARDRRAAERESNARRAALSERLEEDRHAFQRETLLQLQDELQRLSRNTAEGISQDRSTIRERGQIFIHPDNLSDEGRQIIVSVQRLRARVLDPELRSRVNDFINVCTATWLTLTMEYPGGIVPDGEKEAALARISRLSLEMAQAYQQLTDVLGVHLRRELDRRYLLADPAPASRRDLSGGDR